MMKQIEQTVATARTTEQTLAQVINSAADQIDQIGISPLAEALARLAVSTANCKARLNMARNDAVALLADLTSSMTDFMDEVTATAPQTVQEPVAPQTTPEPISQTIAPPAPSQPQETAVVVPSPEPSQVICPTETLTATAANPSSDPAPKPVLSPVTDSVESDEVKPTTKPRSRRKAK
jgi:hypothetical protein